MWELRQAFWGCMSAGVHGVQHGCAWCFWRRCLHRRRRPVRVGVYQNSPKVASGGAAASRKAFLSTCSTSIAAQERLAAAVRARHLGRGSRPAVPGRDRPDARRGAQRGARRAVRLSPGAGAGQLEPGLRAQGQRHSLHSGPARASGWPCWPARCRSASWRRWRSFNLEVQWVPRARLRRGLCCGGQGAGRCRRHQPVFWRAQRRTLWAGGHGHHFQPLAGCFLLHHCRADQALLAAIDRHLIAGTRRIPIRCTTAPCGAGRWTTCAPPRRPGCCRPGSRPP